MTARPRALRRALTLIEIIIAVAVFAVLSAAVLSSLTGTRDYEALGAAEDDLAHDAHAIFKVIADDLTCSGWCIPDGSMTGNATPGYSALTSGRLDAAPGPTPTSIARDRGLRYFPYVQQIRAVPAAGPALDEGQADAMPWTWTDRDLAIRASVGPTPSALPSGLPGSPRDATTRFFDPAVRGEAPVAVRERYRASFYARSQELIFLRTTTGTIADPGKQQEASLTFPGTDAQWRTPGQHNVIGTLRPGPVYVDRGGYFWAYRDAAGNPVNLHAYGVPLDGGMLKVEGDSLRILPNWQRLTRSTANYVYPIHVDELGEQMYVVVPSRDGLGRLVRASATNDMRIGFGTDPGKVLAKHGPSNRAMVVDRVLSEHVVRILFDTARTDAALGLNQVRVRLFLARRSRTQPDVIVRRIAESVFSMRAKTGTSWEDADRVMLGSTPAGMPY